MKTRPEDIIPDEINAININGANLRKGSFAAVLANAEILASNASEADKRQARAIIAELAPALAKAGILKHIEWKNPEIQTLFEKALIEG